MDFSWFKDKLDKHKIIALILATIGVGIATSNSDAFAIKGIVLAVLSAVTYAGYLVGIEKSSISGMNSMKAMFYMCIVNTIAVFIFDMGGHEIVYA